jgi:hypothetical protein
MRYLLVHTIEHNGVILVYIYWTHFCFVFFLKMDILIKSVENGLQLVDSHQIFGPSNYFALFIFYDLH